ncbi:putative membrane protein YeiB [Bacillus horti]|uniref:Membrane protein YeiB n=1 Tax=Caldalkalibacillus horti TaxID=77523 RepID=A0ABT9VWI2_9BACI|nr:putative membrane protein YeiB [Bacillus horti]
MLAAAGKRSLTCYVLQSALIAILLSEPLIGLGGRIDKVHNQ